jgi:peptidoglycan/xylan/chitin deacetylase (PgdA/CDA1 family)
LFLDEIQKTNDLVRTVTGTAPTLFRPPFGKLTLRKLLAAWRARQTVILWNVDPKDFEMESAERLLDWFRLHPLRGGDVVLLHDTVPHAAAAIVELVEEGRRRGLVFSTPQRWLV